MFRPMRRFKQQLEREECIDILKNEKRGVLALSGDEGYPYALPLNFVLDGDTLFFHSAVEGHKIDAIRSNPKASFCVIRQKELCDDGWSYYVDSVIVFGKIRVAGDEETRLAALSKLGNKYFPNAEMTEDDIRKNAARAKVLALDIEHLSGKHVHER